MKTIRLLPILAVIILAAGCQSTPPAPPVPKDGRVTVTFEQPDKFTDAASSYAMGTDKGYLNDLQNFIDEKARVYLADGQKLAVNFTDIDLAGDFRPDRPGLNDVRVIKAIYLPRLKFTYTVTDAAGKTVSEGTENLTDMNFMSRIRTNSHEELFYEHAMLVDWMSANLRK